MSELDSQLDDETCIITISGDQGSGKSTVGKLIASALGCVTYSAGDMQRRMATNMGLTSLELNKLSETDPSIDRRIDSSTVEIAEKEKRVVFDSRLAWHFVPQAFKVFLTVDPVVGAERILKAQRGKIEQYESLEQAIAQIQARRESEEVRFWEMYDIRLNRLTNYQLIVDSSSVAPETIAEKVVECYQNRVTQTVFPFVWLSPQTVFPVFSEELEGGIVRYERHYFTANRTILEQGIPQKVPVVGFPLLTHRTADTLKPLIEAGISAAQVQAWEAQFGFAYPSYPTHLASLLPRRTTV
jgi:cytidylate kinase